MSSKINGSVCLNHPNVPAVAHCATCRKPICADCAKTAEGITCCSKACLQNALDSRAVVGDIMARKKKNTPVPEGVCADNAVSILDVENSADSPAVSVLDVENSAEISADKADSNADVSPSKQE